MNPVDRVISEFQAEREKMKEDETCASVTLEDLLQHEIELWRRCKLPFHVPDVSREIFSMLILVGYTKWIVRFLGKRIMSL